MKFTLKNTKFIINFSILIPTVMLTVTLTILCFSACNSRDSKRSSEINTVTDTMQKPKIVVTINPLKLIIQELAADDFEIITLLPPNVSPHTFEPKPSDIARVQDVQLLFYVADNLDGWSLDIVQNVADLRKIELINFVIPQLETLGFPHSTSNYHHSHSINTYSKINDKNVENSREISDEHNENQNIDPHFWTSPTIVKAIVGDICRTLTEIYPENAEKYSTRAKKFIEHLNALHSRLSKKLETIKTKQIFTLHNSFNYFINDFGLIYGGSLEEALGKEAGAKYFKQFIDKVVAAKVKTIFSEPQLNARNIKVAADEAGVEIIELDPLGTSINQQNYFDFIEWNATNLLNSL